jgi:benzoyl-CoA reductase/2-hydroxyglutaryl-CoA dehydratase subunit BcrC/BadD/HgdB
LKKLAYMPPFIPPEWIEAHGFAPQVLMPEHHRSAAVLAGLCPMARAVSAAIRDPGDCEGIVIATTCDQLRRVTGLVENGGRPVFLFNMPATWQTPAALKLYCSELRRLGDFLVGLGGSRPSDESLAETILNAPGPAMPVVDQTPGIRLALIAGHLLEGDRLVLQCVKRLGGRIVFDSSLPASRAQLLNIDRRLIRSEPFTQLAIAYFNLPDVFRRPNTALYQWLKVSIDQTRPRGIILARYAWCDLWHAEVGRLRDWAKLPLLDLELGDSALNTSERISVRIQAFLESLR